MQLSQSDISQFLALLQKIKVTPEEFDEFLVGHPHIYRSIRGHAFEVWFDREMEERGYTTENAGGDSVIDRKLNGKTLQLKTPYWKSTKEGATVGYRMHKTHGAEVYPDALYKKEEFADFLIAMHPTLGVIVCPKQHLMTRSQVNPKLLYGERIADPLLFSWENEWLNKYSLLGVDINDYPKIRERSKEEAKYLPKLISKIGFTDYDIIKALLDPSNFRIWNQLIQGSIREFHFEKIAQKINLKLFPPKGLGGRENQKVDYVTKKSLKIQVKGLTKGLCKNGLLGCETQCSHSRQPIRLYKRTDFDVLVVVIDPNTIDPKIALDKGINVDDYNFLVIPMNELPKHPRSEEWGEERIKASIVFDPAQKDLNKFELLFKSPIRNN